MSTPQAATRLHPGIVVSVILVSAAAVAAAVLIIRKYCFPVNRATYRYSALRRLEDEASSPAMEEEEAAAAAAGEESDEDLLE